MKPPEWLKVVWWGILGIAGAVFSTVRFHSGDAHYPNTVDTSVSLVWLALLLLPLLSEVSIGGVTLKKEVEALKTELKEQLVNIRSEIQNTTQVQTQVSPNIFVGPPPPDYQLPALRQQIQQAIRDELGQGALPRPPVAPEADVPPDTQFLFSVRFALERELRRLAQEPVDKRRALPVTQLARQLVADGRITPGMASSIREVYAICSPAIHGEQPSGEQVGFVRDVGPELVSALRAL